MPGTYIYFPGSTSTSPWPVKDLSQGVQFGHWGQERSREALAFKTDKYLQGRSKRGPLLLPQGYRCDRVGWGYPGRVTINLKKLCVAMVAITSIFFGSAIATGAETVPDEQWNLPLNAPGQDDAELIGLEISAPAAGKDYPSYLVGDSQGKGVSTDMLLCASANDPICTSAANVNYNSFLPPCDVQITINCISSVSAISADSKEIVGQYSKSFPVKSPNVYVGDASRNLPNGSHPSVWKIPGVTHGGGEDNYLLRFKVDGNAKAGSVFRSGSIKVSLFPVTTKTGQYTLGNMTDANHPSQACLFDHYECGGLGHEMSGNDTTLSAACVSFDVGLCALRQAFPEGYRFKVGVRLGDSPTGWFHGRLINPLIGLTSLNGITILTVDATPVKVPAVGVLIKQSEMSAAMRSYYAQFPVGGGFGRLSPNGISNLLSGPEPSSQKAADEYALWSNYFKDTASATQSEWSFRTLELNGTDSACFNDKTKLVGVVSTNAMFYSGGAPAFNKSDGSLNYKVGAPHFASNGDIFKGSYDLQLRSDVARCLYNFSSSPLSATIEVTSSDGSAQVATTIVTERDGWLYLSAKGFTFSSPTVKVKMTQEKPAPVVVPAPATTPAPVVAMSSANKSVAKSITCTKGKSRIVVKGAAPKCPTGYKRK